MKESPYYGSTSANESSTKDNNRTTTPNSNNSNSRSTRYLSYSHNVSKRNFLILHHLSVITIIHFTEIQARLSESKQTSLEAMFSRRIDKISLTDSSLMKKLKFRQQKANKMKTPGHQPHLGWKIQP